MTRLRRLPNLRDPDGVYEQLVALHQGLDDRRSAVVNAKLIIVLINHVGDERIIHEALAIAREAAASEGGANT